MLAQPFLAILAYRHHAKEGRISPLLFSPKIADARPPVSGGLLASIERKNGWTIVERPADFDAARSLGVAVAQGDTCLPAPAPTGPISPAGSRVASRSPADSPPPTPSLPTCSPPRRHLDGLWPVSPPLGLPTQQPCPRAHRRSASGGKDPSHLQFGDDGQPAYADWSPEVDAEVPRFRPRRGILHPVHGRILPRPLRGLGQVPRRERPVIRCRRCGDPYAGHEDGGGPCQVRDADGRCPCQGFLWVDPVGTDTRHGYAGAPTRQAR